MKSEKNPAKRRFESLAIDVSDQCNLRCSYCFERAAGLESVLPVNPDRIFEGIDFFLENLAPPGASALHFHFGRREPLLNFPLLSSIAEYLRKKGRELSFRPVFHLTTNGTLLDPGIVGLLLRHEFDLRVSLDGHPDVHDANRKFPSGKGSFARVAENLEILKNRGVAVTVNAVYSPAFDLAQICGFFGQLGLERVDFFPLWVPDDSPVWRRKPDGQESEASVVEWSEDLADKLLSSAMDTGPRIVLVERYLQHLFGFRSSPYYCGAGRNYIGVSSDGGLVPCLKFRNTPGWSLGNIDHGIDDDAMDRYLVNVAPGIDKLPPCSECPIRPACKGVCYLDRLGLEQYGKAFAFYCSFNQSLFAAASRIYDTFKDRQPGALVRLANLENVVDSLIT